MRKTTRWRPSSCDCVIEYDWDTDEKEPKTLTLSKIAKCPGHQSLSDQDAYERVKSENKWINRTFEQITSQLSVAWDQVGYKFRPDRVIEVTHPRIATLTATQKSRLQNAIDDLIGAGRVVLV